MEARIITYIAKMLESSTDAKRDNTQDTTLNDWEFIVSGEENYRINLHIFYEYECNINKKNVYTSAGLQYVSGEFNLIFIRLYILYLLCINIENMPFPTTIKLTRSGQ